MKAELATPELRRLIRAEALARWAIKALEAKLKPTRPTEDDLRAFARAAGPGHSDTIYDEHGRPIGLYTVMDGRETVDVKALISAHAKETGAPEDEVRSAFEKKGAPFLNFKEA